MAWGLWGLCWARFCWALGPMCSSQGWCRPFLASMRGRCWISAYFWTAWLICTAPCLRFFCFWCFCYLPGLLRQSPKSWCGLRRRILRAIWKIPVLWRRRSGTQILHPINSRNFLSRLRMEFPYMLVSTRSEKSWTWTWLLPCTAWWSAPREAARLPRLSTPWFRFWPGPGPALPWSAQTLRGSCFSFTAAF